MLQKNVFIVRIPRLITSSTDISYARFSSSSESISVAGWNGKPFPYLRADADEEMRMLLLILLLAITQISYSYTFSFRARVCSLYKQQVNIRQSSFQPQACEIMFICTLRMKI